MAAARVTVETRTIANAGVNMEAFDSGNCESGTFSIPSTFTGTGVTPQMSNDGTNWTDVGSSITVATNGTYELPALLFKARYARLVAGSSQSGARTITLALKR